MSPDAVYPSPLAFSGQRLDWRDLPRAVRARIAELAGSQVSAETSATTGFSPGFAAVLELADGRGVFVKAVSPEQNPTSPEFARAEIRAAAALPPEVPAPRLLWFDEDGDWVLLGFEVSHGRPPLLPWDPEELALVLEALVPLAHAQPLPGHRLPRTDDLLAPDFTGWRSLARWPHDELEGAARLAGDLGRWAHEHLDDLVRWEQDALRVCAGDALVHGDLRADNIMIDRDRNRVALIDWPHASVGAPWLDLAFMLPSIAMQGGGDPQEIFWSHPVSEGVSPADLRAGLAGLAGFFAYGSLQPAPLGIPNLRRFQRAQGAQALAWLRDLA
ncbi:phosphotransferase [Cellulomonas cellasea]|uniref:Aminoglycoside phosphotransferase (APT) family kinase protein n=1 Tax=Cellulomonas cellasea TaxID=43670 RepID=A0A7W4Y9V8_9CELL|nr:phosphotransferase [Cellulomonas cellasea]MBB2921127.1 aminoglycoside phosphotransferase (APT) family kinase protein [Cellulomonas cellasea]